MSIYADTNFLLRLYLERPESRRSDAQFTTERPRLPITWLLRIELINAIEQTAFFGYGEDEERITPELAAACQAQFRDDLREGVVFHSTDIAMSELTRLFEEIALRRTARGGFHTYDILHVASARALSCAKFWSFDKRANRLARLEGLRTI